MVVNPWFNEQRNHVRLPCMMNALLIGVFLCEARRCQLVKFRFYGGVRLVALDGNRTFCYDLPIGVIHRACVSFGSLLQLI